MGIRKPEKRLSAAQEHARQVLRDRLNQLPKDKTVSVSGRLSPSDKAALAGYFGVRGLTLSSGITMVLKEFMNEKGIG